MIEIRLTILGSIAFSLRLDISMESPEGRHLSLIQHLVALAVVLAAKLPAESPLSTEGETQEMVPIGVKWPNDVYGDAGSAGMAKLGGVLVTTSILGRRALVNVGCGLNLDNGRPTVSLNDVLVGCRRQRTRIEPFLARILNRLEQLLDLLAERDGNPASGATLVYPSWYSK